MQRPGPAGLGLGVELVGGPPGRVQQRAHPPDQPAPAPHFLFTWRKTQGIDDALIQPYSGHESRQSLKIYSRLARAGTQQLYNEAITRFPI